MGLTPREVTRAVNPACQSRDEQGGIRELTTPFHPGAAARQPARLASLLPSSLSALFFFPSPSLCWQPSPNKMQCLQQVCPAAASLLLPARSPQTKLLGSAPPGSCHLTLANPAGVLPSVSLGHVGRGRPAF